MGFREIISGNMGWLKIKWGRKKAPENVIKTLYHDLMFLILLF